MSEGQDTCLMRIVIVSDTARVSGGAEKVALTSAIALAKAGHEVIAFTGTGPVAAELAQVPNLKVWNTDQLPFYEIASKKAAIKQVMWNQPAADMLAEVLADLNPKDTIVHFHSYLKVLSGSTLAGALDRGFPTVVTLHDYGLACPNMGFYNYQTDQVCHLSPMGLRCVTTNCTIRGYANKLGLVARGATLNNRVRWRRIKHFIAVSQTSGEIMRPFLRPDAQIHFVRNPAEIEKREPVDVASNDTLLYVGRLEQHKDPVALAVAAREAGMKVKFVGDGPLRAQVESANPDAEVTGWVTPDEVQQAQREARALVMPSRWYEAAPLVIFDALAAGLPVVVGSVNAGREFITPNETGLVYDSNRPWALAEVLAHLKDDAAVARMGATAYERYWADPSTMDAHVAALETVYQQVIG